MRFWNSQHSKRRLSGQGPSRAIVRSLGLESLESRCLLAVVHWTGQADDLRWSTALNWEDGRLPVDGDEVVIGTQAEPATILYDTGSVNLERLETALPVSLTPGERFSLIASQADISGDFQNLELPSLPGEQAWGLATPGTNDPLELAVVSQPGEIRGSLWHDLNGDGQRDAEEPGLVGWAVYVDQNESGRREAGEPFVLTDLAGDYRLTNLLPGEHLVRSEERVDWQSTSPAAGPEQLVFLPSSGIVERIDFAHRRQMDFGDAPASYPTQIAVDGGRHGSATDLRLGALVAREVDGTPSVDASADGDEEDGVAFLTDFVVGEMAQVQVTASAAGRLSGWFDFNADGDWDDAGEAVWIGLPVAAGQTTLTVNVPSNAAVGSTYARFRLASRSLPSPRGFAATGEVEDYQLAIEAPPNLPPVARDNRYTTDEDTPQQGNVIADDSGQGIDADPDVGDQLQVVAVNGDTTLVGNLAELASGAMLTLNSDGTFLYDPSAAELFASLNEGEDRSDSFSYTVADQAGLTSTATVTLGVTGRNDRPVAEGFESFTLGADILVSDFDLTDAFQDVDNPTESLTFAAQVRQGQALVDAVEVADGRLRLRYALEAVGPVAIEVTATDPAGLTAAVALNLTVDRVGPQVDAALVEPVLVDGLPGGLRFTFVLSEAIPAFAASAEAIRPLLTLSADGTDVSTLIDQIEYQLSGDGLPRVVVEATPSGGLATAEYRLTFTPGATSDGAGNRFLTAETVASFAYDTRPPRVEGAARAEAALVGELPNLVVLDLIDVDLQAASATNPANYRLERLGPAGVVERVLAVTPHYDRYADRILLSGFGRMEPGNYRLTVQTTPENGTPGLLSRTGVALDGDGDGQPGGPFVTSFTVSPATGQTVANPDLFQRSLLGLDAYLEQTLPEFADARQAVASLPVAERLLAQVRLALQASSDLSPAESTAQVNQVVSVAFRQLQQAAYRLREVRADEFVVVWARDRRFLLSNPAGSAAAGETPGQIGFTADGIRVETLPAGVLADDGAGLTLAIVPVDLAGRLLTDEMFVDSSLGDAILADLKFALTFGAQIDSSLTGVVAFPSDGQATEFDFSGPQTPVGESELDLQAALQGTNSVVAQINAFFIEEVRQIIGDHEQSFLVMWLDPVDFVLTDQAGNRSEHAAGVAVDTLPGAFYGQVGISEILIVPGIADGRFELELVGVGSDYRGTVNLLSGDSLFSTPLSGNLSAFDNLVIDIDFGLRPPATVAIMNAPGMSTVFFNSFLNSEQSPPPVSAPSLLVSATSLSPRLSESLPVPRGVRDVGGGGSKELKNEKEIWRALLESLLEEFDDLFDLIPERSQDDEEQDDLGEDERPEHHTVAHPAEPDKTRPELQKIRVEAAESEAPPAAEVVDPSEDEQAEPDPDRIANRVDLALREADFQSERWQAAWLVLPYLILSRRGLTNVVSERRSGD